MIRVPILHLPLEESRLRGGVTGLCGPLFPILAVALGVALTLVSSGRAAEQRRFVAPADLAFVGVDVLAMEDGGGLLRDQTVLVAGPRITARGARTGVSVPEGARIVDGLGRVLMPGLVDAHVHLRRAGPEALRDYLRAGITTARDMNGRPWVLDWRDWIEAGDFVGPRLRVASPALGSWSSPGSGYPTPATRAEAEGVVRRFGATGYDWVKVYTFLPAEGFRGILRTAGPLGLGVGGHVPVEEGLERTITSGVRSIEHLTEYIGNSLTPEARALDEHDFRSVFGAGDVDWSVVDSLVEATVAAGVWNVPTLIWLDRFLPAPGAEEAWSDRQLRAQGARNRRQVVRRLHEAGARLAVGTDSDAGARLEAAAIHEEMAAFVEAGLEPAEVLGLATVEGARLLGLAGEQGTVDVGQRADLLLVTCDPRGDLACLRAPEMVVAAGRVVVE